MIIQYISSWENIIARKVSSNPEIKSQLIYLYEIDFDYIKYEPLLINRIYEYNSLVDKNEAINKIKSFIKSKEVTIKIKDKKEIESLKKKYIENMTNLYYINYEEKNFKCRFPLKEVYFYYLNKISNSKLAVLKDYEEECQLKSDPLDKNSIALRIPSVIGGYIDLIKTIKDKLSKDNLSDKLKKKISYLLYNCIYDISTIEITYKYLFHNSYINDAKNLNSLFLNESFNEKCFEMIDKNCKLKKLEKVKLKNNLEKIKINYLLF